MNALEITPALRRARKTYDEARQEHDRVAAALHQARHEYESAEVEALSSAAALETAEAASALGGTDSLPAVRKKFSSDRGALDFARARIAGIENRLRIAAAALPPAESELRNEYKQWAAAITEELDLEYQAMLAGFFSAVDKYMAVALALGDSRAMLGLRQIAVPDKPAGRNELVTRRHRDTWRTPESTALFERVAEIRREIIGDVAAPIVAVEEEPAVRRETPSMIPPVPNISERDLAVTFGGGNGLSSSVSRAAIARDIKSALGG